MDFAELQQEVKDRGFEYLNDSSDRLKRWVNQGYSDLTEDSDWPWATDTTMNTTPMFIPDLRDVLSVTGPNGALEHRSVAELDDNFDLTQSGTAEFWYQDGGQVKTYPVDGATVTVRYLRTPADLVADNDVPIVPERYHPLIVDFAVIRALRDRSNYAEADALWQALQVDLTRMRGALLGQEPMFQRLTDCQSA